MKKLTVAAFALAAAPLMFAQTQPAPSTPPAGAVATSPAKGHKGKHTRRHRAKKGQTQHSSGAVKQ